MPNLEGLLNAGVMGNLATLSPVLSPILWTSIATGVRPEKHGILGFTEPVPDRGAVRPVTNLARKVKAVWNILNQEGLRSNVIGWWPSHPAEPINGVMVSNHYQQARGGLKDPWPMLPGTVHPPQLAKKISQFRIHPVELVAEQVLPFAPNAHGIDPSEDKRFELLIRTIAECSSVHACATAVMQNEPWDFMAIYYDSIDHFCHGFMRYHPPRRPHIPEKEYELYKDVVTGAYLFHDLMLGTLLKLAGEDTTVIVMSDHGFHSDALRPSAIPLDPAGPAIEHSHHGIFVMRGPGIRCDVRIYGASVLDITPTVLTLFGLPVGENMDGKPLVDAFEKMSDVLTIPSWEDVEGDDGRHPPHIQLDPDANQAVLDQLVALGYIDPPGDDTAAAVRVSRRECKYNLAQSLVDAGKHSEALEVFQSLWDEWPEEPRFAAYLAHTYLALKKSAEARQTAEALFRCLDALHDRATAKLAELKEKTPDWKLEELTIQKDPELLRLLSYASPNRSFRVFLQASILIAEGKSDEALNELKSLSPQEIARPDLWIRIGQIHVNLRQWAEAERSFRMALEGDSNNARAQLGLAVTMLETGRDSEAVEHALSATALLYFFPQAHFYLGVALTRLGHFEDAVRALEVAVTQRPRFRDAFAQLTQIYQAKIHRPDRLAWCVQRLKELDEGHAGSGDGTDRFNPASRTSESR